MTEAELKAEWDYRYAERLAIGGCYGEPTPEQHKIAKQEADETIRILRNESN